MKFSPTQQSAINAFRSFLKSDEQVFMLKGAAGTGKTTLVFEFLNIIREQNRPFNIMAPTGRAAHIIGNKTKHLAYTIHKSIYSFKSLKPANQNNEDGDSRLHARFGLRVNEDSLNAIYIVDEASMVSDAFSESESFSFGSGQLLSDLFSYIGSRKIVFVGDYAQLPPIGMNFSPALDEKYIEDKFRCKVIVVTLEEVLRQSSNSKILENVTTIRENIQAKSFIEFKIESGVDCVAERTDILQPYYKISPQKPNIKAAVITYSNSAALFYNQTIRRHYFGKDCPRLLPGDLLMIARNNYAYDAELFNGNIVRVESCDSEDTLESKKVGIKTGNNRLDIVELKFRKVVIRFNANGNPISLNVLILDNFLDDESGALGGLLAQALIVDFNKRLPQHIKDQLSTIRRLLKEPKDITPQQLELCDSYLRLLKEDPYYNAVICKYGYAMTCHKAQGGEWENVFVDMGRYGGTANENYFRWAYTALTRTSKNLWHYHSPDFNYISNIVVEPIQSSTNIKVSTYSESDDFCTSRFLRIKNLCNKAEISITENRSANYQHRVTFSNSEDESASFTLWYNANGYSGRDVLQKTTSEEFAMLCRTIIDDSYIPGDIPFSSPNRPFAEKLVNFIRAQIKELDIKLLYITQENYHDVFHLKTDGVAKVSLFYTGKGNYTYMRLQSSIGSLDNKLEAFRHLFI